MTKKLSRLPQILASIASIILIVSFIAEVGWNKSPCLLCQLQRGVYSAFIASIFLAQREKRWLNVAKALLIAGAGLAIYHTLLQLGFLPSICLRLQKAVASRDDLTHLLTSPSCTTKSWTLFGVPAAAYNGVIFVSFFVQLLSFKKSSV